MKIAAYNGWNYEYVEGSWSDLMDMLKKMCLAETINAVSPDIKTEPVLINAMLTNWTVPLKIMIPDARDQSGPNPCFCMRSPKPIPSTMKVTMIGNEVLNASLISVLVILSSFITFFS